MKLNLKIASNGTVMHGMDPNARIHVQLYYVESHPMCQIPHVPRQPIIERLVPKNQSAILIVRKIYGIFYVFSWDAVVGIYPQ